MFLFSLLANAWNRPRAFRRAADRDLAVRSAVMRREESLYLQ